MTHTRIRACAAFVAGLAACPSLLAQATEAAAPAPTVLDILLPVQGGRMNVGVDSKTLIERLEKLHPFNEKGRIDDARKFMSELGPKLVDIEPFLMSKNLVTMKQYKIFVEKTGHRFPFDWWRFGESADYEKRLAEINKEFPEAKAAAPRRYWQAHYKDLPYSIPTTKSVKTRKDEKMDDYPVVFVSWRDAVAFAAWAGMRLPSEEEWIYAATGGQPKHFLWGNDPNGLQVKRGNRYDKPLPVGAHGEMTQGPFGHQDMVLHVFEWVGNPGFFPFDQKAFEKERERFLKNKLWKKLAKKDERKVEELLNYQPNWRGPGRIAKGGWFGSTKEQLAIGLRAAQADFQIREGLGFRVAKSLVPARDIALSKIRLDYDMSYFGADRRPNLNDQIGVEHYEMTDDNLIAGYKAISFVPVNHMGDDKVNKSLAKFQGATTERPRVIGTLVCTEKMLSPDLPGGIYTVLYRKKGVPKDLQGSWKSARKDVAAADKAKKSNKKKKDSDKEQKPKTWKKVIAKYGLTEDDVRNNKTPKYVRVGGRNGLEVPCEESLYILRDNEGKWISTFPGPNAVTLNSKYEKSTMEITPTDDGHKRARIVFGAPTLPVARKHFMFTLDLKLDWP